jgi:mannose-6-phosphate isomerase-like protein (cupin superfamily)
MYGAIGARSKAEEQLDEGICRRHPSDHTAATRTFGASSIRDRICSTHDDRDQFFRIEEGKGVIVIDGRRHEVQDDFAVIVPAGARHNVINFGPTPLKLYTLSVLQSIAMRRPSNET